MFRLASIAVTAAMVLTADVPGIMNLRPAVKERVEIPPGENLPVLPSMQASDGQAPAAQDKPSDSNAPQAKKEQPLQPESRLALVRFVDGEFARVVEPIPAGRDGFRLKAGAPVDEKALRQALGVHGSAVNPGDRAQITRLVFKEHEIQVEVNGGGRGKTRLRDRIHMDIGGMPSVQQTDPVPSVTQNLGGTVILDFGRPVPDITPDQLKSYLSGLLDFSKQHSAAVQWVESLPPAMQTAIKDKRAAVGMDRDMVIAAVGRPDRKVRERTPDGTETEDWIFGKPPAKTVFVKFEGDKVISVEQFPQ
jgi:hypothetical protein